MLNRRRATFALFAAIATFGAGSAVADAATSSQYRNCPTVTKKLYPAPVNLVSSYCKGGFYYERLRLADSSWSMSPDGKVTTSTTTYQKTIRRGPARGGAAPRRTAVL